MTDFPAASFPAAKVRTFVPADAPSLKRIASAALRFDRPDAADLVDLLWPQETPHLAVVAEVDGDVVGFAFGSLGRTHTGALRGHINIFAVDPAAWRRGYGNALLAELEERLVAAGAAAEKLMIGGATFRFAWPGIDVRYTAASCLAEARGYRQYQPAMNMTVELDAAARAGRLATEDDEARLAGHGVTVRRLDKADTEKISPWLESWGGTWRQELLSTLDRPSGAGAYLAVLRDGEPDAQYVGFAGYGVSRPDCFGPMGTASELRKLGIGRVLLRRCLADVRTAGYETAQITWVEPVAFYSRTVDAFVERMFWIYRNDPADS